MSQRNGYYGLDLTMAHFMFEDDAEMRNDAMPKLAEAFKMIKEYQA